MTDPETLAERDIDRAVTASRAADKNIWVSGAWASRVVGKYQKYATRDIADKADKDPSTIENYVHAFDMYTELRKVRNCSELRRLRHNLTPSHFWNVWQLRRKYDLSLESVADHLEQMVIYKIQGKPRGSETLRQEVDAQEDKLGNVPTWNYYAPRVRGMMTNIMVAKDTPEEIREAAEVIVRWFSEDES